MFNFYINPASHKGHINPEIQGHFSEHLGRGIYEGLYVKEEDGIDNENGMRKDVVDALRELRVPVLRWPGGCFADEYHWKDGIGPKENRKKMINTHWGGVVEDNSFGTHEFFRLCELLTSSIAVQTFLVAMPFAVLSHGRNHEVHAMWSFHERSILSNIHVANFFRGLFAIGNIAKRIDNAEQVPSQSVLRSKRKYFLHFRNSCIDNAFELFRSKLCAIPSSAIELMDELVKQNCPRNVNGKNVFAI